MSKDARCDSNISEDQGGGGGEHGRGGGGGGWARGRIVWKKRRSGN